MEMIGLRRIEVTRIAVLPIDPFKSFVFRYSRDIQFAPHSVRPGRETSEELPCIGQKNRKVNRILRWHGRIGEVDLRFFRNKLKDLLPLELSAIRFAICKKPSP